MARIDDDAEISAEEILDELYQRFVLLPPQEGEFTRGMFAAKAGITTSVCDGMFTRMLASGEVEQVMDDRGEPVLRLVKGHKARVYRRTGDQA